MHLGVLLIAALWFISALPEAARLGGPPRPDAAVGSVRVIPDMQAARAAHTATPLRDGRVLIVGGFTRAGTAPDAEFFDPLRGTFAPAPRLQMVRHSHSATRLDDGRVLIAGGYGDETGPLASAEVYDPRADRFTSTGAMRVARANHVAAKLSDGRVLVIGGLGEGWTYLDSAELFDPATGGFTSVAPMTVPREGHAAAVLANGQVLVAGGHAGPRRNLTLHASAELFDPRSRTFQRVGSMTTRRHKHDLVALQDGRVLVTGGSDERDGDGAYASTEFFDPTTRTFVAGPTMRYARYKHLGTSIVLRDGRVLVAGGAAAAEVFDPASRRFMEVPTAGALPGLFSAAAPLDDGGVLISGGYGPGMPPSALAWTHVPAPPSR